MLRLTRLLRKAGREMLVLWYACRQPSTPVLTKLAALLLALYVFVPMDVLPDWLLLFGWIDDVTLLALGIPFLLRFVPAAVLQQARTAADAFSLRHPLGGK